MAQLNLPFNYQYQYQAGENHSDLLISLSTSINKFDLPSPLGKSVSLLEITEGIGSFFLYKTELVCEKLFDFIQAQNIEKVIIFGSKYSSSAAFLWSAILESMLRPVGKSCHCICVDLNNNLSLAKASRDYQSLYMHTKSYVDPLAFIKTKNLQPFGAVYLSKQNHTLQETLKQFPNFHVFNTEFDENDINYFIKTNITASRNGYSNVFKQKKVQKLNCNDEFATLQIGQNLPTPTAIMKSIIEHKNYTYFLKNHLDLNETSLEGQAVYFVETFNQYINAINCQASNQKYAKITIIAQYTRLNLKMMDLIINYHLENNLHNQDTSLKFYEIHLSNQVNFLDFFIFNKRYEQLIKKTRLNNLIVTSSEYRTAILCHTAKSLQSKVFLIEEGLGTYDQINRLHINKNYRHYISQPKHFRNYTQESLIENFGNSIMKKAIKGFLEFDSIYIAVPSMLPTVQSEKYNPVEQYILENQNLIEDIQTTIQKHNPKSLPISVYADQTFGFATEEHYQAVIKALDNTVPKDHLIVFQLHPKNFSDRAVIQKLIEELDVTHQFAFIDFNQPIRIELLVSAIKPEALHSITSSSLFYTQLLFPEVRSFSLADEFLKNLNESGCTHQAGLKMVFQHAQELKYLQLHIQKQSL
ncbi:alpha-2,8-polysialyltransferase family protein [Moraxella nasicaprae]|uniref:Alpha-2,8-polysialyltransferase family protein n=1 Tax=Moraxella nasicaprae TaxID=2904122 RepID=A0ABY6F203_9GAMM|nr:alpha-2,8-polysialyltransferase family protein [Moraxella nasicaprae]UXZ04108.1 alpha-2,8-polysialyltransferase family protein [Moraxella nasicaprae]